jgi:hypothetical protein
MTAVAEARQDAVLAVKAALAGDDEAVAMLVDDNAREQQRLIGFLAAIVGFAAGAVTVAATVTTDDPDELPAARDRLLAELSRRCVDGDGSV